MNQLSWLLYVGNVAGNLGMALFFIGLVMLVASVANFGIYYSNRENYINNVKYLGRQEVLPKFMFKNIFGPFFAILTLLCWLIGTLCPSSETVYAIAASQMGEKALQSPVAIRATKALEIWLDKQISSTAEPASK